MPRKPATVYMPQPELTNIDSLRAHPLNYKGHPADQVAHLAESIRANGIYRNVVVARDGTILAGHGVVEAARSLGYEAVPVVRLNLDADDPRALKVVVGDNEIAHLGVRDDRALSELLRVIAADDPLCLLGTGYNQEMLATLAMVTRPATELADFDAAAEWAGMPSYENPAHKHKLVISFPDTATREQYVRETSLRVDKREVGAWSTRWPWTDRDDLASQRFEG